MKVKAFFQQTKSETVHYLHTFTLGNTKGSFLSKGKIKPDEILNPHKGT